MTDFILKILGSISPPTLIGILAFAMINFFVPKRIIDKINIAKLDEKATKRMWLLMIGSASLLFGILLVDLYDSGIKPIYSDYSNRVKLQKRVRNLTSAEIDVLKTFVDRKHLTNCWHRRLSGTLKALERDKVIYLISKDKIGVECYNIERWAYFYLLENPELLKPAT